MHETSSLSAKVEWLFQNITRPDGREYSPQEVEEGTAQIGHRVSAANIAKIRAGQMVDPGILDVQSLIRFFNVSPAKFFGELEEEELERYRLAALEMDPAVIRAALYADKLPLENQGALLEVLERINSLREGNDSEAVTEFVGQLAPEDRTALLNMLKILAGPEEDDESE